MSEMSKDSLVSVLEEAIIFGHLLPRERLVETELMEQYGAKRHMIRTALNILTQKGLVQQQANKGSRVKELDPEYVEELYAMRESLLDMGMKTVDFPLAESTLENIEKLQAAHDEAITKNESQNAFRANEAFHDALIQLFNNRVLTDILKDLEEKSNLVRSCCIGKTDLLEQSRDDHHAILAALKEGDGDTATEILVKHIRRAKEVYLKQS